MLLSYGAKNYFCFSDWVDIDLRLNGYVPESVAQNNDFSTITVFEGANASGKTNALKILAFITDFVKNSFYYQPKERLPFDTFFSNDQNADFYIEFRLYNIEYRYESILSHTKVIAETLLRIDGGDAVLFKREGNAVTENSFFDDTDKIILRDNASCISTFYQYGVKRADLFYDFFNTIIFNVSYDGLRYVSKTDIPAASHAYFEDRNALDFANDLIKRFDTGITKIKIDFTDTDKRRVFFPIFYHETENETHQLTIDHESNGTKMLFLNLLAYYEVLMVGGVLALDELELSLHPDILPHLLALFTDKAKNRNAAQLLFTCHNADVLDITGKYRSYLVEKEHGESFCYRLDEAKTNILRNDRAVSVPYKRHYLGGYPKIEA